MISIKHLTYQIGERKILDDLSLQFSEQGVYGIIGPNGAGKSTLLKHMMKLHTVPNETIFFDNKDINTIKTKAYAKKCSFVFQENRRDIDLTVEEVVLMGRYAYGKLWKENEEEDQSIARSLLREMGLWEKRNQSIHSLSGGEAQKVFIVRALVQQTPVILLDEPTSMLDIHNSIELLTLLKQIRKTRELTVIMVIHDLNLAFGFCDKIALLDKGKLIAFGASDEIIQSEWLQEVYHYKLHRIVNQNQTYIVPKIREENE